jgi:hypothetical protein
MKPTLFLFAAGLAAGLTGLVPAASAASCWDLWYERNAIFDRTATASPRISASAPSTMPIAGPGTRP